LPSALAARSALVGWISKRAPGEFDWAVARRAAIPQIGISA
jgi:hypothetical protein